MTYLDLLKYLIDVQKIEKEDLAELIGIPQKKMDSVLSGALPLKKKWLKNLSLYTGIPKEAILAGNFVLNTPEGEPAPVVKDAYVPEAIRQGNTQRLNAYVKKRYSSQHNDLILVKGLSIFGIVVSWLILIAMLLFFEFTAVSDIIKIMLMGIIPAIIGVSVMRNVYKFAKKGVCKDEKTFKYYTVLTIAQIFIYVISTVAFKWISPIAIAIAVGTALPLIYQVFIVQKEKVSYIRSFALAILWITLFVSMGFLLVVSDKFGDIQSEAQLITMLGIFFSGWLSTYLSIASVFASSCYYQPRKTISKHFGPVIKKPAFKNNRISRSIISIILAGLILFGSIYTLPVLVLNKIILNVYEGENKAQLVYCEYDKTDIAFSAEEKTKLVEEKNYTVKIPEAMVKNEKYNSYRDSVKNVNLSIRDEYIDCEEIFDDMSNNMGTTEAEKISKLKETIKKEYGFFPKTEYEYYKLQLLISEDKINPINRDLVTATTMFKMMENVIAMDTTTYLYEDSEKVLCVRESIYEKEDGGKMYMYDVSGNAKGDYSKFFDVLIMFTDTNTDMDLPFKIINSIEMK